MQVTRSSVDTAKGPNDWFTGDVYIDPVAAAPPALTGDSEPGALRAQRTHRLAPSPAEPDRLRHRRRRIVSTPRRTHRNHPPRRPRPVRSRRGALARRRTQPTHGPPRHQRSRRPSTTSSTGSNPSRTTSTWPRRPSRDAPANDLIGKPSRRFTWPRDESTGRATGTCRTGSARWHGHSRFWCVSVPWV